MHDQQWFKKPEMIIGLSALTVSLVAVLVGVYSAYIDRAYARASVWPRLEIARSFYDQEQKYLFKYQVVNSGTGPAIIKYAKVKYGTETVHRWKDLFSKINTKIIGSTDSTINNRIIPAVSNIDPITIYGSEPFEEFIKTEDSMVSIELCYCSIYEQCWLVDKRNIPIESKICSIAENEKFLQ